MEQVSNLTVRELTIRYGLIGGGGAMVFTVLLYVIHPPLLFNPYFALVSIVILLLVGILAALRKKKEQEGYITYGESIGLSMLVFFIGFFLFFIFSLVLYQLLDPSLNVMRINMTMDKYDEMLEKKVWTKELYLKMVNYLKHPTAAVYILGLLSQILGAAAISLLIYLISSIFIKNDSPFKPSSN